MDFRVRRIFHLVVISSLICAQIRADAETSGSVFFIDNPKHQYVRTPSQNDVAQSHSMLLSEVGAAVSILLGFAPPATLSATGSSKLNKVLMPNPFDRPRAVFMLEVRGVADPKLMVDLDNTRLIDAYRSNIIPGSNKADIQLPDEDEVSVVYLDEQSAEHNDKEIRNFASWLGGSYVADTLEPLKGELMIPVGNGDHVNLHMSKKAEREFALSLLALSQNIKRAMDVHENLAQSMQRPAELMMGSFDAIKALQEQYGHEGVGRQGMKLLLATLCRIFDSLQTAYEGQIVGVLFFNGTPSPESETVLNLMFNSRPSSRMLAEAAGSRAIIAAEVFLVRRTLAWLTGIILLIATLLGIYFLFNMPLTRDTLLYSNVKLD
ncbi:Type 1 membrane protein [Melia azedarach]|uniref:Type 1 membrane protein n=1 Tax=Melia azedarach TaxID=155640 RepID=A0ACC1YH06_MELAZ|nr:Type 1 membrane protein [Melia azedarach]